MLLQMALFTMEYYSAIKRNEIELFVVRWIDLESVIQNELSQKEKNKYHIYALAYGICFSLSDLIHSVSQTLSQSTSLQITQFHFFLWLSNIPLYICATSSLSIHLSMDI